MTFVLGVVGYFQWLATDTANKHNAVIERAYVTMSHRKPGLRITEKPNASDPARREIDISISVQVINHGNTPATVTYSLLQFYPCEGPLPEVPPYDTAKWGEHVRASLVKDVGFNLSKNFHMSAEGSGRLGKDLPVYVLGYVDYIDRFGGRHRAGYARRYNHAVDDRDAYTNADGSFNEPAFNARNNLPFVKEPGYNYDRKRNNGEGSDWNQPTQ